jgi:hypothetical protein
MRTVDAVIKLATVTAVTVGNTVGQIIPYKCGNCGDVSRIARYGGNVVQGNIRCPTCGKIWFCLHYLFRTRLTWPIVSQWPPNWVQPQKKIWSNVGLFFLNIYREPKSTQIIISRATMAEPPHWLVHNVLWTPIHDNISQFVTLHGKTVHTSEALLNKNALKR